MQGATEVALTVLDVLGYLDEIPVCVGYEIDGEVVKDFPVTAKLKKKQNQYTKYFQDGKKKYVESKNTTNYQKTVVNTSNSSKKNLAYQ